MPTALIADDEPHLSADLASRLTRLWPAVDIVAAPTNGVDALAQLHALRPDVAFLDIRMPGLDGLAVARLLPGLRVVFVTAYADHAIPAFDVAAADYLLKPVSDERLLRCVARLQDATLHGSTPAARAAQVGAPIQWLTVGRNNTTWLIATDDVLYFRAADKYTEVVTVEHRHVIRTPIKDLLERLDPARFVQVHRSVIVALQAIDRVERDLLGRMRLHLRGHAHVLPVSRTHACTFRQM